MEKTYNPSHNIHEYVPSDGPPHGGEGTAQGCQENELKTPQPAGDRRCMWTISGVDRKL